MKKIIILVVMLIPIIISAQSYYKNYRGNTHYVHSYVKKNGTVVTGHYSGNPKSGVHCHNNMCQ